MAAPSLALYVVLHKDDAEQMVRVQHLSSRHVSPSWPEIGLRQDPDQALERFEKIFGTVDHSVLVLVEVLFSAHGIAKWATELTNQTHQFMPRLYKKTFWKQEEDWGVWHFVGDLPLEDTTLVTVSFGPVNRVCLNS
jgi:hypothetical protein